jgi:hypothetical protein
MFYDTVLHCWATGSKRMIMVPLSSGSSSQRRIVWLLLLDYLTPKMKALWSLGTNGTNNTSSYPRILKLSATQLWGPQISQLVSIYKITWCPSCEDSTLNTHTTTASVYLRVGACMLRSTINNDIYIYIYTYRSTVYSSVSQTYLTTEPFWALNIQTEPKRHLEK